MGRLIDADALIEDLKGSLFYSDSIPFVEDAPTAYDVEAVDLAILDYYKKQIDKGRQDGWEIVDDCSYIRHLVKKGGA